MDADGLKYRQVLRRKGGAHPSMNVLGTIIDKRIDELETNQAAFAEFCGISESGLSLVRRGKRTNLKGDTLYKLARGLGITVDTLLELSAAKPAKKVRAASA